MQKVWANIFRLVINNDIHINYSGIYQHAYRVPFGCFRKYQDRLNWFNNCVYSYIHADKNVFKNQLTFKNLLT